MPEEVLINILGTIAAAIGVLLGLLIYLLFQSVSEWIDRKLYMCHDTNLTSEDMARMSSEVLKMTLEARYLKYAENNQQKY